MHVPSAIRLKQKVTDQPVLFVLSVGYTVEMHAVGPTHESVQPPLSDEVLMDTNPAYAVSTAGTVKVEDNPAYQTMTTNPGGGGGAGREIYYYEDIINDRNVKMTQNPAYTVP